MTLVLDAISWSAGARRYAAISLSRSGMWSEKLMRREHVKLLDVEQLVEPFSSHSLASAVCSAANRRRVVTVTAKLGTGIYVGIVA